MAVPSTSTIRVRPFTPADRDAVLGLARRLTTGLAPWRDPDVALAAVRRWIAGSIDDVGPERAILVAEDSTGACLGFASVERDPHWTGEDQAYVQELVVAEAAEGRGVGRALMAGVEAWAQKQGFRVVELDTGATNTRARAFYARLGYTEESVKLVKVLQTGTNATSSAIRYRISPPASNDDLNALFAAAWPHHRSSDFQPILRRSLAYVCAYASDTLIGFVNVAWDGGIHAFLLDTTVHPDWQRRGIGRELVMHARTIARERGMHWLHVDYEPHLDDFYRGCGFEPTPAGLMRLQE